MYEFNTIRGVKMCIMLSLQTVLGCVCVIFNNTYLLLYLSEIDKRNTHVSVLPVAHELQGEVPCC